MPSKDSGCLIFVSTNCRNDSWHLSLTRNTFQVCGPPGLYETVCGDRSSPDDVTGILGDLGYSSEKVYKF